ncbi:hypothetical protein [Parafilimonas sp.]|uniref:hypothetical protein n=1 Tax=Parafilimonas sp. TaxID=1969739 RepID=UPI0039E6D6CF
MTTQNEKLFNLREDQIKSLAEKMKPCVNTQAKNDLAGAFLSLTSQRFVSPENDFEGIRSALRSITCLLTNPKISSQLDCMNAGTVLYNLMVFFEELSGDKEIHKYLLYKWLELYHTHAAYEADFDFLSLTVQDFLSKEE